MAPVRSLAIIALVMGVMGCSEGDQPAPPVQQLDAATACAPGELSLEGGACQPPGVLPDGCGEGFVHDGNGGCEPLLPPAPCSQGQMAIPGETKCREVAPCGQGKWGDISVEATTQYVDGSYSGADSDGSADRPWTTIQEGIDAASPGAIVAVAEGSYAELVAIMDKPVQLWGRCPAMVELLGAAEESFSVVLFEGADGSALRSLAVRGHDIGIAASGATQLHFDRLWIHHTGAYGMFLVDGPTDALVSDCLIEAAHGLGLAVWGAQATVERSVVRGTLPGVGDAGVGVSILVPRLRSADPWSSGTTQQGC